MSKREGVKAWGHIKPSRTQARLYPASQSQTSQETHNSPLLGPHTHTDSVARSLGDPSVFFFPLRSHTLFQGHSRSPAALTKEDGCDHVENERVVERDGPGPPALCCAAQQ